MYYFPGDTRQLRAAIRHHLTAMECSDDAPAVLYVNAAKPIPRIMKRLRFRAIVFHTTFLCMRWSHLFYSWKWDLRWLAERDCLKIAFPQDEYDHSEILDEWLEELGVHVVFSNFDQECHEILYPRMRRRARIVKAFTGYIDERIARDIQPRMKPMRERSIDVIYRAFKLPYWFGSHGQRKSSIAEEIAPELQRRGIRFDVSTRPEDVIVGDAWFDFMALGRCVLGCESGSSVLDRRGEIQSCIRHLLSEQPDLTFEDVDRTMPEGWDDYRFFAISPRHFEAVLTKTAQVLLSGRYDDVLVPDRHYISLKSDLSNLNEVVEKIRDETFLQDMVDTAYREIYEEGEYTYRHFANMVADVMRDYEDIAEQPSVLGNILAPIAERSLVVRTG